MKDNEPYQRIIAEICKELEIEADPRHIEGFMRLQFGTLSHLPHAEFVRECKLFALAKEEEPDDLSWEDCAISFGL